MVDDYHRTTTRLNATWLANGTFSDTGITGLHQNLTDWPIPDDMIIPLLERADTTSFLFVDEFNGQSGAAPQGWTCGDQGVSTSSGIVRFSAGGSGTDNAYCHTDLSQTPLNQTGKATFHFRVWVRDGYNHFIRA